MAVPRYWDCEVIVVLSVKESDLPKKYRAQVRNKLKSKIQRQQVSFQDRIDAAFEREKQNKVLLNFHNHRRAHFSKSKRSRVLL